MLNFRSFVQFMKFILTVDGYCNGQTPWIFPAFSLLPRFRESQVSVAVVNDQICTFEDVRGHLFIDHCCISCLFVVYFRSWSRRQNSFNNYDNPLNPSLQTTFSPHMPWTHHISISVHASSDSKTAPMSTSGLNKQSCDFDHTHSLTSM